ncbi:NRDE-2, necessary for RNA interference-domain-containing protein [Aspergillus cavernicola]|uniref:NRDE-2, necessary for RNA interference-domain-containing protein n=1 Tax=Aspergillus cavernicola TaxID=176166 RepID=A0ABR4HGM4_9EURO
MDSSGSQEKKAIPRFASFKPQLPPPDSDRPSNLPGRKQVESKDKSRHRSKHRSGHRSHHGYRSRSREHRSDRRESHRSREKASRHDKQPSREPTPSSNTVKEAPSELSDQYVVDRNGDKYILVYGTVHRYSVPRYYRIGRGRVLGLPPNYRIDRETIGENEITVKTDTSRTDSSKARAKRLLSSSNRLPPRLLRVRPTSFASDPIKSSDDFVPLKASRRKQQENTFGESDTDDEKDGYRSIHGKLKHDEGIPSDLELMSDTDSSGDEGARQGPDADIRQRNVELSRNVEQRPAEVEAWVRLIDHQETVLRGSAKQTSSLTSAEQNGLADIKLSLYEKALKKVGQSLGRDRLLIGLLEEGSKLWDTQRLLAQWHSTLKSNSQYISLWVKYLNFRQTEFLNFTHDRCLATFTECLGLNKASPDSPEKVRVQMYLFLRLTLFLREAGYMEQAIGLWQAVLESTFFQPQELDINTNANEVLSAFSDFWDSEVARIGEIGAKGWKNSNATLFDAKIFEPQCHLSAKSIMASWSACEGERMLNSQLPARSLDEPEDDPYRVVLASDLRGFLPLASLPNSTHELVDSFLYFCQLPPIITVDNLKSTGPWMGDSFMRNDVAAVSYANLSDWLSMATATEPSISSPTIVPHQHFIHNFDTYFADPVTWFLSLNAWVKATSHPSCGVFRDWVRRALRLLVEAMPRNEELAEYTVAVEFVCNPKEAKKYAKSLLKKWPSRLRLYNSYALMERRTGGHATADHVRATAISMSKSFSAEQKMDSILLWHTWIWELLETRNIAHASHLLVCMPQNNIDLKTFPDASSRPEFSPAHSLKIRNYISETQESAIANRKPNIVKACTDCQAILLYLTNASDLNQSLEAYSSTIHRLNSLPNSAEPFASYTTELLHQSRAKLLYHHLRTITLYKPSHIRTILTESITLFPHNTIFLSLFAWNESRFRIEERVRDIMRDITTSSQHQSSLTTTPVQIPITSHLFSIYTELTRPTYAGSTLHSARAAFEKAIGGLPSSKTTSSSSSSSSSITLWKLYILFELSQQDITRAKTVFYRAMRACPWSKDILMLAFSHLREDVVAEQQHGDTGAGAGASRQGRGQGMNFHELRHVYNVLVEKELRIHIDIERDLDCFAVKMENESGAAGMLINMPDDGDAGSGDEVMQM